MFVEQLDSLTNLLHWILYVTKAIVLDFHRIECNYFHLGWYDVLVRAK